MLYVYVADIEHNGVSGARWKTRNWRPVSDAQRSVISTTRSSQSIEFTIIYRPLLKTRVGIAGGSVVEPPPSVHVYRRSFLSENRL